jgi:hypothetical protein
MVALAVLATLRCSPAVLPLVVLGAAVPAPCGVSLLRVLALLQLARCEAPGAGLLWPALREWIPGEDVSTLLVAGGEWEGEGE